MSVQPTLQTDRLNLRPFLLSDAKKVQELAGDLKTYAIIKKDYK